VRCYLFGSGVGLAGFNCLSLAMFLAEQPLRGALSWFEKQVYALYDRHHLPSCSPLRTTYSIFIPVHPDMSILNVCRFKQGPTGASLTEFEPLDFAYERVTSLSGDAHSAKYWRKVGGAPFLLPCKLVEIRLEVNPQSPPSFAHRHPCVQFVGAHEATVIQVYREECERCKALSDSLDQVRSDAPTFSDHLLFFESV
jgi:hypothetical protein